MEANVLPTDNEIAFANPFHIEDVMVFDDPTLHRLLHSSDFTIEQLAYSLHGAPPALLWRIWRQLSPEQRTQFLHARDHSATCSEIQCALRSVLDSLFWELTYWKTPHLYDQLTSGEHLHPGIFLNLEPDIRGKTILDVGAGSGRASFECVRHGAALVYAVEPSTGLLRILRQKLARQADKSRVVVHTGTFDALPLAENSVDLALSCSAFTSSPEQGGEPGLAEMQRVTRPGGKIVLIWPRVKDHLWLVEHGFQYVALPVQREMYIHFRSMQSALACVRRFYARNRAALRYLLATQRPEIPFSILGINPPCDYCWREVVK
ncbi:MAG TPA: class I SAM-dependent methyltransferase [Ktedonosporobacter sp.]|nr:class I SAM-dependent methyltransferase [Ktedonosporobacter sp.]